MRGRETHGAIGRDGGDVAKDHGLDLHVSLQQANEWLHYDPKLIARGHVVVELGHAHHHLQSCDNHTTSQSLPTHLRHYIPT